ncbi:MAG: PAS-domain containing protein, partial [Alphaproteobacteria bacterium]
MRLWLSLSIWFINSRLSTGIRIWASNEGNLPMAGKSGIELRDVAGKLVAHAESEAEKLNWRQCFERLEQGVAEDEIKRADGTWLNITRARTPGGDTIVLHSDITRYKQQEAALQAQAAELQLALENEKELNNTHR